MKPSVSIQLDKVRNFRYDRRAIARAEDLIGKPLSKINLEMQTELATVIWAGLVYEDNTLTVDTIFDFLDDYDNELIVNKMSEAIQLAYPETKGKNK